MGRGDRAQGSREQERKPAQSLKAKVKRRKEKEAARGHFSGPFAVRGSYTIRAEHLLKRFLKNCVTVLPYCCFDPFTGRRMKTTRRQCSKGIGSKLHWGSLNQGQKELNGRRLSRQDHGEEQRLPKRR